MYENLVQILLENATTDLKAQKRAELQAEAEGDDVKAAQVLPERIAVVVTQGDYHKALYETSARGIPEASSNTRRTQRRSQCQRTGERFQPPDIVSRAA